MIMYLLIKNTGQFLLKFLLVPFLFIGVSDNSVLADDVSLDSIIKSATYSNEPLADYQNKLLELAIETATLIPVNPHIKDRSRKQQEVVEACIQLDQPRLALDYLEKIKNWRRGLCLAELAFYCVENGLTNDVEEYLTLAHQIAEGEEDWRVDRVRASIAKTYTLLGEYEEAGKIQTGLEPSETGKALEAVVKLDQQEFDEKIKKVDDLLQSQNFDIVKNGISACVELYEAVYEHKDYRGGIERRIDAAFEPMPVFIRVTTLMDMSEIAIKKSDKDNAQEILAVTQEMMDSFDWPLRHGVAYKARLAELLFKAGEQQKGKLYLDDVYAVYKEQGQRIVDIWRAGALRPVAEAYHVMDETELALEVYKRAVEESVKNPNSRPHAEDLTTTCISMALHEIEPDPGLWLRLKQIHEGLGEPW